MYPHYLQVNRIDKTDHKSKREEQTLASRYECVTKIQFSYLSTKTYVVGTQKNRLNETVL